MSRHTCQSVLEKMTETKGIYTKKVPKKNSSSFLLCLGDWHPTVILDNITDEDVKGTIELKSVKAAFARCHRIIKRLERYQIDK